MTSLEFFWKTGTHDGEFFFLYLNLSAVPTNSVGHITHVKQVRIIAMWNKTTEMHNSNDVFLCVAVAVANRDRMDAYDQTRQQPTVSKVLR